MRVGPTRQDWLLAIVSAVFTAGGIALGVGKGDKAGFAVAAFFGGGFVVSIWMLALRIQNERHRHALRVEVPSGVPIRARPTTGIALSTGVALVGASVGAWGGAEFGAAVVAVSYLIAAGGAVLAVLLALGVIPMPYLQFEPAGLRFGQRSFSYLLQWDNIAQVAPGDIGGHDALFVAVGDLGRLVATVDCRGSKDDAVRGLTRQVQLNRGLLRCDLAIMPLQFGADMALLLGAIKQYIEGLEAHSASPTRLGR